jgi:endonuclease G
MKWLGAAVWLIPTIAVAGPHAPVIGGSAAAPGTWPDVAAVMFAGSADCTGTLVAPTVVITAGHCNDPTLDAVLIGTSSLARPGDGETIPVVQRIEYPSSWTSIDVTVLVLARPAIEPPRPIASGWVRYDIVNGAPVAFVGYGSIDKNGNTFVPELQEARSTITDFDCTTMAGCNTAAKPDGELGAGGMGIDTCPGDSGGPLYLVTDYGTFLAGVTSRGYDTAMFACSEGGIYERPDKIVDWIEAMVGGPVSHGPEPTADAIVATRGDAGETLIAAHDPRSKSHDLAIATQPAHGTARVRGDGYVRVCTDADATGDDQVVVRITDADHPARTLDLTIPITIEDGAPPRSCDVDAFSVDAGGCCDSGRGAAGSIPLSLAVLVGLRRRRR